MDNPQPRFLSLAAKTVVCHTITYMFMGILASHFLNYAESMARPDSGMRHMDDPLVMAGGLFQPLRGLVFASVFYLLRGCLFGRKNGWALMAWMLIALGILSTFGPVPGSMEGMVYTTAPIRSQITGWLEIVPQAVLLSALLCYWVDHPEKKWLSWVLGILFFIAMALPVLGLLVRKA
jgi:hypothetical protein